MKICSRCKTEKDESKYSRNSRLKSGRSVWCKTCHRDYEYERYHNDPEHRKSLIAKKVLYIQNRIKVDKVFHESIKAGHRRSKYGVTGPEYARMSAEQENKCYLCYRDCSSGRELAVDHDHTTGKVRGLLCGTCNLTIGRMNEDTALLRRMADYLDRFSA